MASAYAQQRRRPGGRRLIVAAGSVAAGVLLLGAVSDDAAAAEFRAETHQGRAYKLFIPTAAEVEGAAPAPLVVMLHGCTQDPDSFAADTRMNEVAEDEGFFVVYPNQPASANDRKCWNWFLPAHQARGGGEPADIVGIVRDVEAAFPIDGDRVYVAGLSAGAAMSAVLGATYPDAFAAIGIASGLPYRIATDLPGAINAMFRFGVMIPGLPGLDLSDPAFGAMLAPTVNFWTEFWRGWYPGLVLPPTTVFNQLPDPDTLGELALVAMGEHRRVVPAIVVHGTADHLVKPVNGDEALAQWAQTNDLALDGRDDDDIDAAPEAVVPGAVPGGRNYTESVYEDDAGHVVMHKIVVDGMGHAWSGGAANGSTSALGGRLTDPLGPDASRLMWQFFEAHPKDGVS